MHVLGFLNFGPSPTNSYFYRNTRRSKLAEENEDINCDDSRVSLNDNGSPRYDEKKTMSPRVRARKYDFTVSAYRLSYIAARSTSQRQADDDDE